MMIYLEAPYIDEDRIVSSVWYKGTELVRISLLEQKGKWSAWSLELPRELAATPLDDTINLPAS